MSLVEHAFILALDKSQRVIGLLIHLVPMDHGALCALVEGGIGFRVFSEGAVNGVGIADAGFGRVGKCRGRAHEKTEEGDPGDAALAAAVVITQSRFGARRGFRDEIVLFLIHLVLHL